VTPEFHQNFNFGPGLNLGLFSMLLDIAMQTWKIRDDFFHVSCPYIRIDGKFSIYQQCWPIRITMILTVTIKCVFGMYLEEECIRVIEIEKDVSLYSLHEAIQDAVQFGRDHPFGFYTANSASPFASKHWLTEQERWEDMEDDWHSLTLGDVWPLGRKKLYYIFDFGDQWTFEIRKSRGEKEPTKGTSYPRVIQSIGPNPEQYPLFDE
jgi:hypothetical protein